MGAKIMHIRLPLQGDTKMNLETIVAKSQP